jgi:hypothetical protein
LVVRLDGLDARTVFHTEIGGDGFELGDLRPGEGRQLGNAGLGGQREQPFDLHMHTAMHQAEFAEDGAQRLGFAGVAAVQRGQGGEGMGGHRAASGGSELAILH